MHTYLDNNEIFFIVKPPTHWLVHTSIQIDLFGSIIIIDKCYESNFKYFDVLLRDLAFLAKGAAFLALTTLKLQNTEITWLEIPNGPNDKEKSLIFCT